MIDIVVFVSQFVFVCNELNFVWFDMEMMGFDLDNDCIIEIVVVVINFMFDIVVEGLVFVIYQSDEMFVKMDDWNKLMYGCLGLIDCVCVLIVIEVDVVV